MKLFFILFSFFIFTNADAHKLQTDADSLCKSDEREPSQVPQVGRINYSSTTYCSGGMVGESCYMTAGHCINTNMKYYVEFNTPPSKGGTPVRSAQEDVYYADMSTLVYVYDDENLGDDYAIMQLKPNTITNKLAGQVQGHYDPDFSQVKIGTQLQIAGYGITSDPTTNQAQQINAGPLIKNSEYLEYIIDTTGGNSGSLIVPVGSNTVVGIHTNGGCDGNKTGNAGTYFAVNTDVQKAIESCLKNQSIQ